MSHCTMVAVIRFDKQNLMVLQRHKTSNPQASNTELRCQETTLPQIVHLVIPKWRAPGNLTWSGREGEPDANYLS